MPSRRKLATAPRTRAASLAVWPPRSNAPSRQQWGRVPDHRPTHCVARRRVQARRSKRSLNRSRSRTPLRRRALVLLRRSPTSCGKQNISIMGAQARWPVALAVAAMNEQMKRLTVLPPWPHRREWINGNSTVVGRACQAASRTGDERMINNRTNVK